MPDAIVEPAANVAAPATPTPTPPSTTPDPSPPVDGTKNLADKWVKLVTQETEDPAKPKPVDKKPEEKAEPKAEPAAKEKPIKVRKAAPAPPAPPETRPPIPTREEVKPVAAVAPPAAVPAEDDAAFEKGLFEEEQALLDDARAAEKILGAKYKGHATKTRDFLKESAKKEKAVEAGEMEKAEYQEWYEANRPKISPLDFRAIERERVKEDVKKEFEPKLIEERHSRWVESETPKIAAMGDSIKRYLWNESLPQEVTEAANERLNGVTDAADRERILESVRKDFALEMEVSEAVTSQTRDDIVEFYRLMAIGPEGLPLKKRNFDLNTPEGKQHDRIAKTAHELCDAFRASGAKELKRDGKWFATWKEWATMTAEQQSGWWTFSNDEIAQRIGQKAKVDTANEIKQRKDYLESRGFKRTIAAPAKPIVPPPAPYNGSPPAPRVAPPPSSGGGGQLSQAERLVGKLGGTEL